MAEYEVLKTILADVMQMDTGHFDEKTELLGALPAFDSVAVMAVIAAIEKAFDVSITDDAPCAENFATVGALQAYIDRVRSE